MAERIYKIAILGNEGVGKTGKEVLFYVPVKKFFVISKFESCSSLANAHATTFSFS